MNRLAQLVPILRLVASLALVVLVAAFFAEPLKLTFGPRVMPTYYRLGFHQLFQEEAAPGFILQISSRPPGAELVVDGSARGRTPAMANIPCSDGDSIVLLVRKSGFVDFQQSIVCREGQTLKAQIQLEGGPPGS